LRADRSTRRGQDVDTHGVLRRQVQIVPEPARRVLAAWREEGNPLPARMDAETMVRRITHLVIDDHAAAQGTVVFDRGTIDCLVYARYLGCDETTPAAAARTLVFGGTTFLTPPWPEIYSTDAERTMGFDDVLPFHDVPIATHKEFGVDLVEVPALLSRLVRRSSSKGSAETPLTTISSAGKAKGFSPSGPSMASASWRVIASPARRRSAR
jgi:predicted ATPase